MRLVLLVVALTFVSVRISHAEVLIYQGKGKAILPNVVSQYGKTPNVYYVIDVPGRTAYPIFYFTLAGQKQQRGSFPLTPSRYNVEDIGKGKRVGTFSFALDDGGVGNFGVFMLYLRGTETALAISSSATGNYPKKLVGFLRGVSSSNGLSHNDEINFNLTFDAFHTQLANNAFKTVTQAYGDLQSELTVKGYQ